MKLLSLFFGYLMLVTSSAALADNLDSPLPSFKTLEFVLPIDGFRNKEIGAYTGLTTARFYIESLSNRRYRLRFRAIVGLPFNVQSIKNATESGIPQNTCDIRTVSNNDFILSVTPDKSLRFTASTTSEIWTCGRIKFGFGSKGYKTKLGKHVTHIEGIFKAKALISDKLVDGGVASNGNYNFSKTPKINIIQVVTADNNVIFDANNTFQTGIDLESTLAALPTMKFKEVVNGVVRRPKQPKQKESQGHGILHPEYNMVYEVKSPIYKESYIKNLLFNMKDLGLCFVGKDKSFEELRWPNYSYLMSEHACHDSNRRKNK